MTINKLEREHNKAVLLAVLNYLLKYHSVDMVFDGYSPSEEWFLNEIRQTELDITNYRSKTIKRRLNIHLMLLRNKYDLKVNTYIRENTDYEVDIYAEYKTQALSIILKGHIENNDIYVIERYIKAYGADQQEQERITILNGLLSEYETKFKREVNLDAIIYSEVVNDSANEIISPNGNSSLNVQFNRKGSEALTYVNISLKGGTGAICGFKGERLPIKAYWESDYQVIIECNQEYDVLFKYSQVSSYGETIIIKYQFV